jgi:hypothetical protein
MWFDLALALGMTVTDLKARMPMSEFGDWFAYVELFGPVDYRRRYDEPAAMVSYITQRVQGGKAKLDDFLRSVPTPYEAAGLSPVDMQVIAATRKRRK